MRKFPSLKNKMAKEWLKKKIEIIKVFFVSSFYIFIKYLQTFFCPPIPTITHLYLGAVIAFFQGSNIYHPLLEKSTFIPFKLH